MNDLKRFFKVAMLTGIIAFSSISIVFATTESELKRIVLMNKMLKPIQKSLA